MPPIKVLHVIDVVVNNPYLNNLCDHTDPEKVEYSFVTFAELGGFSENLEKRGKKVYAFDSLKRWRYPFALLKLWKAMKQEAPDVVNTHLFFPTLIGLTVARKQGRKTIVTRHHSDALYQLHPVKSSFYLSLERYINRSSDHFIAPSRMVRDILVKKESVPNEKVSVIPYGQSAERYDAVTPEVIERVREELGMNEDLAIVCVSRLYHRKGQDHLLEAFANLVRGGLAATVYFVGEGPFRADLEALASNLGITDRVRFLGWRDNVIEIIGAADIIVHPSLEDALSQSLIESLMLKRPIIATDISGAADTLDGGRYGILVPPADAKSLETAIGEVAADIDSFRKRAAEGRDYLLDYMDAKRVASHITDIYIRVAGSG